MTNAFLVTMMLFWSGVGALVVFGTLIDAPRPTMRDWLRAMTLPAWLWLAFSAFFVVWAATLIQLP